MGACRLKCTGKLEQRSPSSPPPSSLEMHRLIRRVDEQKKINTQKNKSYHFGCLCVFPGCLKSKIQKKFPSIENVHVWKRVKLGHLPIRGRWTTGQARKDRGFLQGGVSVNKSRSSAGALRMYTDRSPFCAFQFLTSCRFFIDFPQE